MTLVRQVELDYRCKGVERTAVYNSVGLADN